MQWRAGLGSERRRAGGGCGNWGVILYNGCELLRATVPALLCYRWSEFLALFSLSTTFFLFLHTRELSWQLEQAGAGRREEPGQQGEQGEEGEAAQWDRMEREQYSQVVFYSLLFTRIYNNKKHI